MECFENHTFLAAEKAVGGVVMDELKKQSENFRTVQKRMAMIEEHKIAAFVDRMVAVANESLGGLRPELEVPQRVLAAWEAKFKGDFLQQGGNEAEWVPYAWWHEKGRDSWTERYKKLNPHMVYKEIKRDNSIIVPAGKYTEIKARERHELRTVARPAATRKTVPKLAVA